MTLPGPDVAQHWQGRTLVDRAGAPLGGIKQIYFDKSTGWAEWALLEAGAAGPAPTFVPLVGAAEKGNTVQVPVERALVERAPSVPAERELSEDQEAELYRHYQIAYSRAESPSGLPAGEPGTGGEPGMTVAVAAEERPPPARAGHRGGELPEQPVPEVAPAATGDPPPAAGRVDRPVSVAAPAGGGLPAWRRLRMTDPRVGAVVAAGLVVAAVVWRREAAGWRVRAARRQLGGAPAAAAELKEAAAGRARHGHRRCRRVRARLHGRGAWCLSDRANPCSHLAG